MSFRAPVVVHPVHRLETAPGIAAGWLGATPAGDTRPAWLRPYTLVTGRISSAPLDLAARMDQVYAALRAAGWTPVVKAIGTDFAGPFGIPVPRDQPLELYLHRTDRPYTVAEAQAALGSAVAGLELNYSALGAWAGEVTTNVVVPTLQEVADKTKSGSNKLLGALPWVAATAIALALLKVAPRGR